MLQVYHLKNNKIIMATIYNKKSNTIRAENTKTARKQAALSMGG